MIVSELLQADPICFSKSTMAAALNRDNLNRRIENVFVSIISSSVLEKQRRK